MFCHLLKCASIRVAEINVLNAVVGVEASATGNLYLALSSFVSEEIYHVCDLVLMIISFLFFLSFLFFFSELLFKKVVVEDWVIHDSPSVMVDLSSSATNLTCHDSGFVV